MSVIRRHDLSKVGFLVNTSVPNSRPAAEWYAARRGITSPVFYEHAMGTAAYGWDPLAAPSASFLATMSSDAATRGLEVLIGSLGVPVRFGDHGSGTSVMGQIWQQMMIARINNGSFTGRVIVDAAFPQNSPLVLGNPSYSVVHPQLTFGRAHPIVAETVSALQCPFHLFHGRIGVPRFRSGELLTNESINDLYRVVDESIAAEAQSLQSKQVLLDVSDRLGVFANTIRYTHAAAIYSGVPVRVFRKNSYTGVDPVTGLPDVIWNNTTLSDWWTPLINGTRNPPESYDLWHGVSMENPWPTAFEPDPFLPYVNSVAPRPGSTVYCNTSFGYMVGSDMQRRGGANWLGAPIEPFSGNQADNRLVGHVLFSGGSLMQTLITKQFRNVAVGDPFHRPFPSAPGLPSSLSFIELLR